MAGHRNFYRHGGSSIGNHLRIREGNGLADLYFYRAGYDPPIRVAWLFSDIGEGNHYF